MVDSRSANHKDLRRWTNPAAAMFLFCLAGVVPVVAEELRLGSWSIEEGFSEHTGTRTFALTGRGSNQGSKLVLSCPVIGVFFVPGNDKKLRATPQFPMGPVAGSYRSTSGSPTSLNWNSYVSFNIAGTAILRDLVELVLTGEEIVIDYGGYEVRFPTADLKPMHERIRAACFPLS